MMRDDEIVDKLHAAIREAGGLEDDQEINNDQLLVDDLHFGEYIGDGDFLQLRFTAKEKLGVDIITDADFLDFRSNPKRKKQLRVRHLLTAAIRVVRAAELAAAA